MSIMTRLLRRQSAAPAAEAVPKAAPPAPARTASAETPAYYEVWGGLESANRALWAGLWFSTTVALLCLALVRLLVVRPPVVIRVSDSGASQVVLEPGRQPPVGEVEVKNFLSLFERFFWGLNFYGHEQDLQMAFSMMTQDCQRKADEMLKRDGTVESLKLNQTKTVVTLTSLEVQKDTPELLECRVLGNRQTTSYKPDVPSGEVVFEHSIVLLKVQRSAQSPYGILVEDFKENVFKKQ